MHEALIGNFMVVLFYQQQCFKVKLKLDKEAWLQLSIQLTSWETQALTTDSTK